jgi:hypothetical protein
VIELHHNRKTPTGGKPDTVIGLDDLYGSTWLPAGAGSVILLTGNAGDAIVGMRHLKQPADEVGPFKIVHDRDTGRSEIWHAADLVLLAKQSGGLTALDAAKAMFETEKPTANEKEKARRRLHHLESGGQVIMLDPGDPGKKRAATWGPK